MIPFQDFSSDAFARLIGDELATYYAALGTRYQRLFYFEGQDPFGHDLPAEAISALYWGLPKTARDHMAEGLIDVLGSRIELVPATALTQIVTAIGLIHRSDMLASMVRAAGQRSDAAEALRPTYASAIMVLKGFAPQRPALSAARLLVGFFAFPNDLVYDVLDLLIRDPVVRWSDSVLEVQSRMEADYQPSAYKRIEARLAYSAQEIATRVSIKEVAEGLADLVDSDIDGLHFLPYIQRRDPLGILVTQLVAEPHAPFEIFKTPTGRVRLRARSSNALCIIPNATPLHALSLQVTRTASSKRYEWMDAEEVVQ